MNIKLNDLMELISKRYKIEKNIFNPYQIELRNLITENEDYQNSYKSKKPIVFSNESKSSFIQFQQSNNHIFNEVIVSINDAD